MTTKHILYFFFRKGLKPVEVQRKVCDSVIRCDTSERWFARFCHGNGSLEDSARSGRSIKRDYGQILSAITSDWHNST